MGSSGDTRSLTRAYHEQSEDTLWRGRRRRRSRIRETEKEEEEEEGGRALKEKKEGEMELIAADTVLDTKDCLAVHIVSQYNSTVFLCCLILVCINLEN